MEQSAPCRFIHLRARSPYSLLEGAIKVPDLVALARQHRMPAVGLTDSDNLFGALEFAEAMRAASLQPVMGMTLSLLIPRTGAGAKPMRAPIALLAQNETGWFRLMDLASRLYLDDTAAGACALELSHLSGQNEGLIALSGGYDGPLDQILRSGKPTPARHLAETLSACFPDRFYVEIQRHGRPQQATTEPLLLDLAYALDLPIVATHEPFFSDRSHFAAHDALLCIAGGAFLSQENRRRVTPEHYFKSGEEMAALFADLPEALDSTIEIARRCACAPRARAPMLPHFSHESGADEAEILRQFAQNGLKKRLETVTLAAPEAEYWKRLDQEIDIITRMKFPGYFLIVADFIQWAKGRGIPVGPGRGSGAGSLAAWALSITDLDPLRFGLFFERFLNPERISMPDFDVDFCQDRREEVIAYVQEKYGRDRVAQIITFGSLQARAVVRDVGRVMEIPFPVVDALAKLIPQNPAKPISLRAALEMEPRLQEIRAGNPELAALLEIALQLEGLYRNASTHAAGLVIADRPLSEVTPLYRDPRAELPATQYNMKWVEPAGLVKFDFLGLKTLTVIDRAGKLLAGRGVQVDFSSGDYSDAGAYAVMASGHTLGVFQLESQGMRDTLRKVKPDRFEDVIALVSLYRPGPMENIDQYVESKFGRQPVDYLHPLLEPVLKETHGVIVYQEQVMQIAQILSGYSLGEADLLRKAMGKKKKEEMDSQKSRFVAGAGERGVDADQAGEIFELVSKFAGYGFNKSHAAAYAAIAYQTAFLKARYPVEFLAASMSLELNDTDKLAAFHQDAMRLGIPVSPPDINHSGADFSVADGKIVYALGAVKNVGLTAMEALVSERRKNGPFTGMDDFAERIDPGILNRRAYESLARAGALDRLAGSRRAAFEAADRVLGRAQRAAQDRQTAQTGLFPPEKPRPDPGRTAPEWSMQERLDHEFASIGFYLSGHPLTDFISGRKRALFTSSRALRDGGRGEGSYRMAGVVLRKSERVSQKGGRFAFVTFSDPDGEFEATLMPEALAQYRTMIEPGRMLALKVRVRRNNEEIRLSIDEIEEIQGFLKNHERPEGIRVVVREGADPLELRSALIPTGGAPTSGQTSGQTSARTSGEKTATGPQTQERAGWLEVVVDLSDGQQITMRGRAALGPVIAAQDMLRRMPGIVKVEEL